ncbi:hypothetical protein HJG60_011749 [Phyllostomus discolor]|uniref:Uncharacterized protein n=1 Tax=Phyllostomus discolor TaxID=89673 RepID=A0A833ZNA3_9CHIR|nr:hypothetical protein HJG60_011749 [Phyllostomus discolor]
MLGKTLNICLDLPSDTQVFGAPGGQTASGWWGEMHPCEEGKGLFQVEFLLSQVTGFWLPCTSPFHSWPALVCLRHAGSCSNHMPCQDLLLHGEECKNIKSFQMLKGEGSALSGVRVWGCEYSTKS